MKKVFLPEESISDSEEYQDILIMLSPLKRIVCLRRKIFGGRSIASLVFYKKDGSFWKEIDSKESLEMFKRGDFREYCLLFSKAKILQMLVDPYL